MSSSSAAVSTGVPLTTVRVRLATGPCDIRLHRQRRHRQLLQLRPGVHQGGASSVITAEASGKVAGFNWLVGDTISSGDRICTITGDSVDNQIESARISVSNASTSLEMPGQSGGLLRHRAHLRHRGHQERQGGDNIEGGSGSTLCVIYDLSYLEMTMSIDELDISSVEVGQEVRITADAVEEDLHRRGDGGVRGGPHLRRQHLVPRHRPPRRDRRPAAWDECGRGERDLLGG
ncbi:MAG: hypothetical protein ACLTYN_02445 [Dysosmobacter welbionis]